MLAAKYNALGLVVTGPLLGMILADVPAVLVGKMAAPKILFKIIRLVAAALFALLGVSVTLVMITRAGEFGGLRSRGSRGIAKV
jgi:Ca2+/H+ antiporter, TMEM165/GDT1 family